LTYIFSFDNDEREKAKGMKLKIREIDDIVIYDFLGFGLESVADGRIDKVRQYYKDIFVLLPGMPVRVFQK